MHRFQGRSRFAARPFLRSSLAALLAGGAVAALLAACTVTTETRPVDGPSQTGGDGGRDAPQVEPPKVGGDGGADAPRVDPAPTPVTIPADVATLAFVKGGGMPAGCGGPGVDAGRRTSELRYTLDVATHTVERRVSPACSTAETVERKDIGAERARDILSSVRDLRVVPRPSSCGADGPYHVLVATGASSAKEEYMTDTSDDACTTTLRLVDGTSYRAVWSLVEAPFPASR